MLTSTCVGGDCCVPSAVRKNPSTIKSRKKLVIINSSEGANTSNVSMMMMFSVVTSCVGVLGGFMLKSTLGIGTLLIFRGWFCVVFCVVFGLDSGAAFNVLNIPKIAINIHNIRHILAIFCILLFIIFLFIFLLRIALFIFFSFIFSFIFSFVATQKP